MICTVLHNYFELTIHYFIEQFLADVQQGNNLSEMETSGAVQANVASLSESGSSFAMFCHEQRKGGHPALNSLYASTGPTPLWKTCLNLISTTKFGVANKPCEMSYSHSENYSERNTKHKLQWQ